MSLHTILRKIGKCTLVGGVEKKGIWQVLISADELEYNERAAAACPVKIIQVV
ncbi:MAG: ferredoxin [Chitinophagia bacterium]|nr:ferredoxin [Chitinophagia bacterium]